MAAPDLEPVEGGKLVDLAGARTGRALDELAALYAAGVDVPMILEAALHAGNSLSVRIPDEMVERTDRLVERLADSPEALAAGGKWGRSAIVRLALRAGLEALERDAASREGVAHGR